MPVYQAPLRDQQFVIHELLDACAQLAALPPYAEVDAGTIDQVLEESGKFCAEVLFPLNASGDVEGCRYDAQARSVTTPQGFKQAWQQFRDAGWGGVAGDPEFGGQGLPALIHTAIGEMQCSANQAWAMYPGLTLGAYECLHAHGTPEQKALYLPKLLSGEWAGTMCLTEPQCGTDLGLIKTRAVPTGDGAYKITGSKIFISAGEHDLTENIVHLVLAKLPDAPEGSRGISLFIVPKFLPTAEGGVGERNGIFCAGIEHKMGIHGNSTCQMVMENATGWLVSEPHQGLAAMFVMMNGARLGVGMQGLGLNEVAYQNAVAYARERLQSRALKGAAAPDKPADPIIVHPDVRRMLLTARAYAEGGRALGYWAGLQIDIAHAHPDAAVREEAGQMLALITPIVKAFLTDNGLSSAIEAQQVFGGHGYIRDNGAEQYVRDARITTIYEGTNTIQALDLLGRKVLRDNGAALRRFGAKVQAFVQEHGTREDMNEFITPLADLGDKFTKLTMEVGMKAMADPTEVGAAATDYLRVAGHLVFAYFWAQMARVALDRQGSGDPFYAAKLATARFYFARLLPEAGARMRALRAGKQSLMAMDADWF
ncbi:acyl-CoA dehydrogenase [Verticiella sediminum]|uniref:3-methylmercaptopropionyl-CoA dehydrogenase n=1 Tax=Verticiella sediminum TaxID=1247510 RepID=A0A556A7Y0_9BURK|nr:acyl-CoA dehydrogenase C-terminal domain-containing protein [Verticiella sediminum]TSH88985.1 acyl-CoA dehydrogenase [Verticiella sediminum]